MSMSLWREDAFEGRNTEKSTYNINKNVLLQPEPQILYFDLESAV